MSAFAVQTIHYGRRLVLLAAAVALVVGVTLVLWTRSGDTTSSPTPSPAATAGTLDTQGPVTDAGVNPWAANDPALVTR